MPTPTILRLFGDKEGLLDAVAEHVMAGYTAAKLERAASEDGDPVEDLRAAWRTHVEFGLANPDLFALLSEPGRIERSPATAAGVKVLEARVARVAAAGLLRVSEPRAVGMIHAAGNGVVLALLAAPEEKRDAGLADAMIESVLGGILAAGPQTPVSGPAPLAVAFLTAVPDLPALSGAERTLLTEWLTRAIAELQV